MRQKGRLEEKVGEYAMLEAEILRITEAITATRGRLEEAQRQVMEADSGIRAFTEDLRRALVGGDQEQIGPLEAALLENGAIIKRGALLIEGLEKELGALTDRLAQVEGERDSLFARMTGDWLRLEVADYDRMAKEFLLRVGRLIAAHRFLRDSGHGETYREVLGGAYEYLPLVKVPIISGFDRKRYLQESSFPSGPIINEAVKSEILGMNNA